MFYDPLEEKIYDFVGGEKDVRKGIIRAIGSPEERFKEDRLRMMRAVRYSTRFNFPIESDTLQAILSYANQLLPAVAMERIWQEFKKMSQFSHFDTGLITLFQLGLLQTIFPALKDVPIEEIQNRVRHIERFPKGSPTIAELLELFPDHSLKTLQELSDYLKLSREDRELLEFLYHAKNLLNMPKKWREKLEPIEWAYFYANQHCEISLKIIAARFDPKEAEAFLEEHVRHRQLLEQAILRIQSKTSIVRAEHLLAEGIKPGKQMGELLREAERISVNQGIEERAKIIAILKKSPLFPSP
jgi:poly(A) polymerase